MTHAAKSAPIAESASEEWRVSMEGRVTKLEAFGDIRQKIVWTLVSLGSGLAGAALEKWLHW